MIQNNYIQTLEYLSEHRAFNGNILQKMYVIKTSIDNTIKNLENNSPK